MGMKIDGDWPITTIKFLFLPHFYNMVGKKASSSLATTSGRSRATGWNTPGHTRPAAMRVPSTHPAKGRGKQLEYFLNLTEDEDDEDEETSVQDGEAEEDVEMEQTAQQAQEHSQVAGPSQEKEGTAPQVQQGSQVKGPPRKKLPMEKLNRVNKLEVLGPKSASMGLPPWYKYDLVNPDPADDMEEYM